MWVERKRVQKKEMHERKRGMRVREDVMGKRRIEEKRHHYELKEEITTLRNRYKTRLEIRGK